MISTRSYIQALFMTSQPNLSHQFFSALTKGKNIIGLSVNLIPHSEWRILVSSVY